MNGHGAEPSLAAAALAAALEGTLMAAITADALGMDRFARLHGKRLRFVCEAPPFAHTWIVGRDGIAIASTDASPADLTVSGPFARLLALLTTPDDAPHEGVTLCGDERLLEALSAALAGLRPDFALLLGPLVGPQAAAGIDAVAQAGGRVTRELAGYAAERLEGLAQGQAASALAEQLASGLRDWFERLREPPPRS